ncbi:putative disease resistance protein RGA1 [Miscanthus floridulus]|uniref:putative disease resistance protein RGA1 n=1 Tax=Miscanthus floridulus TaxID=154761 RepID=UPI00345AD4F4
MAELLLLDPVVHKAADALVQKVTRMWGVDGDRRDLELKRLLYVQSLLDDAEAKAEADTEAGRAVKAWMKELRAAVYQADDVLDDFQYEALRREALSRRSTTSKVLDYFTSRNPLVFRYKATRDLKKVLGKIHKLVEDVKKI